MLITVENLWFVD